MNATFWFTAGVLTGVTAMAVSIPLWRRVGATLTERHPRAYLIGAAGITAFACSGALLYLAIGSPASLQHKSSADSALAHPVAADSVTGTKALSMEEATARLQTRLEHDGGGADEWELLAKSYEFLGRPADASRARGRAAGVGSSRTSATPQNVASRGGQDSSMPNLAEVASQIPALDATPGAEAEISGTVAIDRRLAGRIGRDATLFIYAKAVDSPGPPLAVVRLTASSWPVSFRLDDSMAMIPARRLSQFQKVVVEARISRSGQATPVAGDLYVTSDVLTPGAGRKLALVINQEIG
jgi:hypothetical protein